MTAVTAADHGSSVPSLPNASGRTPGAFHNYDNLGAIMEASVLKSICVGLTLLADIGLLGIAYAGPNDVTGDVRLTASAARNAGAAPTRGEGGPMSSRAKTVIIPKQGSNESAGSWVINVHSLQNKLAAEQFARRLQSEGFDVEVTNVKIRGDEFWRVQLTGFQTEDQARINAEPTKEKLRLKEVWIMKR